MEKPADNTFDVIAYGYGGHVSEIWECSSFEDAWSCWFRWVDLNRVGRCHVALANGTVLFTSDVTQSGGSTWEGERIREIWLADPDDYGHFGYLETEIVRQGAPGHKSAPCFGTSPQFDN